MAALYNSAQLGQLTAEWRGSMATINHVAYAAQYITDILKENNIPYAFYSDWSIRIRGGRREIKHVKLAVDSDDFKELESILKKKDQWVIVIPLKIKGTF